MEIKIENIKTQDDLNAAIAKAQDEAGKATAARLEKKYEKQEGIVSKVQYEELKKLNDKTESANAELRATIQEQEIKPKLFEAFKSSGMNDKAYEDFYNSNKTQLVELMNDKDPKVLTTHLAELRKTKDYLFNDGDKTKTILNQPPKDKETNTDSTFSINIDDVNITG